MIRVVKTRACFFVFVFSVLTPSLAIKNGCNCFCFVFIFIFPSSALIRKAERKRVYSFSWSTEKKTLLDVSGFLVLVPAQRLPDLCTPWNSLSCPIQFIPSFLKDLTGYRLNYSNLATQSFVARNRWLKRTDCDR